ncbi:MAG: phosphatidate cytidylyltransferase [Flavobacteriaceae bacterium]|jgi:phosphatidate cytidylyltransferase|nr:phosphatidate cytidylyltransferase [Flavobacteriaceae bacterium]
MQEEQKDDKDKFSDVPVRVRSWIVIIAIFFAAVTHPVLMCLFVCFLSFWGMKEFFTITGIRDHKLLYVLYAIVIPEYYLLYTEDYKTFLLLVFTYVIVAITLNTLFCKRKHQNINVLIGVLLCVFSIGHLAFIRNLNLLSQHIEGIRILLLLIVLTELNDVFQYLIGKTFGKKKITPKISPNKTVEGFIGGLLCTTILSNLLGIFLLPDKSHIVYSLIGILIAVFGFCGDIYISSFKRKAGIKDTSNLIPGHGGLLDRIDSLLFITPIYYGFIYFMYIR